MTRVTGKERAACVSAVGALALTASAAWVLLFTAALGRI